MTKLILAFLPFIFLFYGCVSNPYPKGKIFYEKGQIEKSVQEFERLEKATPGTCPFWLCKLYSETGEYGKAVKRCEQAVNRWRPREYTEYNDINAYLKDGLWFEDKYPWVHRLAYAYYNTGQAKRAFETLEQYVKKDNPNNTDAFITLSFLYLKFPIKASRRDAQ